MSIDLEYFFRRKNKNSNECWHFSLQKLVDEKNIKLS